MMEESTYLSPTTVQPTGSSSEDLEDAIRLYSRAADELTPDEKKQLERYSARMPPIPEEVAAMSEETLDQRIRELSEGLGL